MEFSQWLDNLGSAIPSAKPKVYCGWCGCDVESEDNLTLVLTKENGKMRICMFCFNEFNSKIIY